MALSMQINNRMVSSIKKSSFTSISCHAKTLETRRGKANLYQVLSLDSNKASADEIKKAYRCKALEFHPDACSPSLKDESTERFIEIRLAYETLSDPICREIYDHEHISLDSTERTYGSWCKESRRVDASFCRQSWERQLHGLKERSKNRSEKRRNLHVNV